MADRTPTAEEIEAFRAALGTKIQTAFNRDNRADMPAPVIVLERGRRYTRIVRTSERGGTVIERSAYGFIENDTGALLKADGWKGSARGRRGSMVDADPLARCDQFSCR